MAGGSPIQAVLRAPGVKGKKVSSLKRGSKQGVTSLIQSIITKKQEVNDPFYILDLGVVVDLFKKWSHHLEKVQPFFAVKCNPEPAFLGAMAALGSGFDCASRVEIESVLALAVSPDRIIYANPCKAESHIKYAAIVGVNLTTFDCREEIDKIRRWHPKCELLIRLKAPDDGEARCPLGPKYWINDGIYGSMNCILHDHACVIALPLACSDSDNPTCQGKKRYPSTVFGPTCDALDTVLTGHRLPELHVNDWLVFPNMGAYTACAGSNFNGFATSAICTYLAYSNPFQHE